MDSTLTQLSPTALAILNNAEMKKMYTDSAKMGASHISQGVPYLTVYAAGRSKGSLYNGETPTDGYFFYKPTKTQAKELKVHILTISRGFRSDGTNDKKNVFNQIVAGVIEQESELAPFVMFFHGLKLQNMWNFGKEASAYTRAKPLPIPMFALTVVLTTKKQDHTNGTSWVVNFEIVRTEDGSPVVIQDPKKFMALKNMVESMEDTVEELVSQKATGEPLPSAEVSEIDAF